MRTCLYCIKDQVPSVLFVLCCSLCYTGPPLLCGFFQVLASKKYPVRPTSTAIHQCTRRLAHTEARVAWSPRNNAGASFAGAIDHRTEPCTWKRPTYPTHHLQVRVAVYCADDDPPRIVSNPVRSAPFQHWP